MFIHKNNHTAVEALLSETRRFEHDGLPDYQKAERELDLENAKEALGLFRNAYELAQKISNSESI